MLNVWCNMLKTTKVINQDVVFILFAISFWCYIFWVPQPSPIDKTAALLLD